MMLDQNVRPLSVERERELVELAQAGQEWALHHLLEAHYASMYRLALKFVKDPHRAEDVTQEAVALALRRIDQFRSEARLGSWLSRIVLNTALLLHRRDHRLVPVEEIHDHAGMSAEPGPEQLAADRELLRLTDGVLESLRDGDQALFESRFIQGRSLKKISRETGLSLPALKTRFHRARQRLKDAADGWAALVPA